MLIQVFCSDEQHELEIGDLVKYKRQGKNGSFDAEVTGIGLKKVGIKVTTYMGKQYDEPFFTNVSPKNLRFKPKT